MLWDQVSAAFRWPFYVAAIFAALGALAGGFLPRRLAAAARPDAAPTYTDRMPRTTPTLGLSRDVIDHLENVASNLQLVADLWYGDAALAVVNRAGDLAVLADARPSTAADPIAESRAGVVLSPGRRARGLRRR